MTIGFVGLGKMGKNMVLHLKEQRIEVVAYNRTPTDLSTVQNVADLVKNLQPPRVIWLMVDAAAVDEVLDGLISSGLQKDDIVIDGGNSFYKDTIRRSDKLSKSGIHYIDCGTSGGVEGSRHGACLMIGGEEEVVKNLTWLWNALAAEVAPSVIARSEATRQSLEIASPYERSRNDKSMLPAHPAWAYLGPSGVGHFVKMVHNGVEYGMDQALGEGFAMLANSPYKLDLAAVADVWNHGSVVRGWLVELLARALAQDGRLEKFTGRVGGGETGRWALDSAKELGVEAEVLEEAIEAREKSQEKPTFATKVVSALRKGYGGHEEKTV